MNLFPAIDLYEQKAVRLYKGDYAKMTVYHEDPLAVAQDFEGQGARFVHLVDLEGALEGTTPNFEIVCAIAEKTSLFTEIGGGIRNAETIERYLKSGVDRVILGTAAVNDRAFLETAVNRWGDRIAVGVDIKDGAVAVKGWTECTNQDCYTFCQDMQNLGVKTLICTDISKDGALKGTNRQLYRELSTRFAVNITASGGISDLEDIKALRALDLYGAIIGKAYYVGAINLKEALEAAK